LAGGLIFLLLNYLHASNQYLKDNLITLVFLSLMPIIAMGLLMTPASLRHIPNPIAWTWSNIFPSLFDLERWGFSLSHLPHNVLLMMLILCASISVYFLIIALRKKDLVSATLLTLPFILLGSLFIKHVYWIPQLIGLFYTWFLCAGIRLVEDAFQTTNRRTLAIIILYCFVITLHIPRFIEDMIRYSSTHINTSLLFREKDMTLLANFAQHKKVTVSIDRGILILPLLVEIGKNSPDSLQFSKPAWKAIIGGYRHWPAQPLIKTPYYLISSMNPIPSDCKVQLSTPQYHLLKCSKQL
jgi:hypothetical protein